MAVLIVSADRVDWLARAYAYAVAIVLLIKIATLIRLRQHRPGPRPFVAPLTASAVSETRSARNADATTG